MPYAVNLNVRFPRFSTNMFRQHGVVRGAPALINNPRFAAVLMPQTSRHFSNEVVGLNDPFRFLNAILQDHLVHPPTAKASRSNT
ncbi:hypothetical protein PMM47T1_08481 [Pseudomonas sp. M47T1]|uniref:hypothetical protein n=1 Tax=Pseudomonas sp. M47T1 TaxID=1179778 RepID=UPI0002607B03|nr:hypothetical protein [Pseudomonas sp. M47T1]EIK97164.1 hypothetical protein PMM47T1_08481 [Pseudomonas sp. M47T1]